MFDSRQGLATVKVSIVEIGMCRCTRQVVSQHNQPCEGGGGGGGGGEGGEGDDDEGGVGEGRGGGREQTDE